MTAQMLNNSLWFAFPKTSYLCRRQKEAIKNRDEPGEKLSGKGTSFQSDGEPQPKRTTTKGGPQSEE